jgi:hypothetical protein
MSKNGSKAVRLVLTKLEKEKRAQDKALKHRQNRALYIQQYLEAFLHVQFCLKPCYAKEVENMEKASTILKAAIQEREPSDVAVATIKAMHTHFDPERAVANLNDWKSKLSVARTLLCTIYNDEGTSTSGELIVQYIEKKAA